MDGTPNARVNNGSWPQKRCALAQGNLKINQPLATLQRWDEGTIRERSRALAEIACQIWLKPQTAARLI